jgi:hypothetical protein
MTKERPPIWEKAIFILGISILASITGVAIKAIMNASNRLCIIETKINGIENRGDEIEKRLRSVEDRNRFSVVPSFTTHLTLLGSGAVTNYFICSQPDMLDSNVTVFSGPSMTALLMLIKKEREISADFPCIGMSATMIPENELMNEAEWQSFKNCDDAKRMVAVRIAEDPLRVGVFMSEAACFQSLPSSAVSVSALLPFIKNNDPTRFRIYSTSQQSGTKMEYIKMFNKIDPSFIDMPHSIFEFDLFLSTWNNVLKNNKPSLFLGSKYYSYENIKQLKIVDSHNIEIIRSLYLYFAVSRVDKPQNGIYRVSGKKGKFLSELKHRIGKPDMNDSTLFVPQSNSNLIVLDFLKDK